MGTAPREPIWLTPAGAAAPPAPRLPTCDQPTLEGPFDVLQRVLAQLDEIHVPMAESGLVNGHLVRALRVAPEAGEAELALSFGAGCGAAQVIAEAAFQRLRHVLPETDIYVRHAA